MVGFDYFRLDRRRFRPKTPAAALRAYATRVLPIEAFLYQATSAKPLDEEPFDLNEIERVLSRKDLDLQTNLLLKGIFEIMVRSEDSETALFAAESINLLENRYNKQIEALKKKRKVRGEDVNTLSDLAHAYFEFAQLYERVGTIRSFYLRESYSYIQLIEKKTDLAKKDVGLLIKVLLQLGLYEQAMSGLKKRSHADDPFFLLLEAEIEFNSRNFSRVFEICEELQGLTDRLDADHKLLIQYWLDY